MEERVSKAEGIFFSVSTVRTSPLPPYTFTVDNSRKSEKSKKQARTLLSPALLAT